MAKELPDPKLAASGVSEIRDWLSVRPWWLSLWAMVAAFGTYFCMYGFRKPYIQK
jgi:predicted MFS family arabinose efflux permease